MLDNKNKSIKDRGWSQMESILDKELPVEKRKRRFGFWFKLGGISLLLLALTSSFYFSYIVGETNNSIVDSNKIVAAENTDYKTDSSIITDSNSKKTEITNDSESISILNNTQNQKAQTKQVQSKQAQTKQVQTKQVQTNLNQSNLNQTIPTSQNNIIVNNFTAIEESNISNTQPKFISNPKSNMFEEVQKSDLLPKISKNPDRLKSNTVVSPTVKVTKEILEQTTNSREIEEIKRDINDQQNEKISKRSLLNTILNLPLIDQNLLKKPKTFQGNYANPTIAVLTEKNRFAPYMVAGINYQHNIKGTGYGLGAGLDYGNSNFGGYFEAEYIRTNYKSTELSNDFAKNADVSVIEDSESGVYFEDGSSNILDNDLFANFDLSVNNFADLTTSIDEIRLSTGVRKRIFSSLDVNAGISYSRLLNVFNKSLSVRPSGLQSANQESNPSYNIYPAELYKSGAYSKNDIIPHIGLEYYCGFNIHVGLNYYHGLNNLIENTSLDRLLSVSASEDVAYRRNISARVRYKF